MTLDTVSNKIVHLPWYYVMVRITENENGKPVDWIGFFGYLGTDMITEGFAYEAVIVDGKPVLVKVNGDYTIRLYEKEIKYTPFDYFLWKRVGDPDHLVFSQDKVTIPCLQISAITGDMVMTYPKFREARRTLVTLKPVRKWGKAKIKMAFAPE